MWVDEIVRMYVQGMSNSRLVLVDENGRNVMTHVTSHRATFGRASHCARRSIAPSLSLDQTSERNDSIDQTESFETIVRRDLRSTILFLTYS